MSPSPPTPRGLLSPRVLSFEKWLEKTRPYVDEIISFFESALASHSYATLTEPDDGYFITEVIRHIYATSANRFRSYEIID